MSALIARTASGERKDPALRRAAVWTSLLAQFLPDLDSVLSPLSGGGNLGAMLQHRGYTHTWALAPVIGAIAAALGYRLSGVRWTRRRGIGLWALGCLGVAAHILLDGLNDYGVHPFWPLWNGWLAGDSLFVWEPLMWFALLPWVYASTPSRKARKVILALAALTLIGFWWASAFVWKTCLALTLGAVSLWAAYRVFGGRSPRLTAWALVSCVVCAFATGSTVARSRALYQAQADGVRLIELVSSPTPGNPWCWRVSMAQETSDGKYRARVAHVSLAPSVFSPQECAMIGVRDPDRMIASEQSEVVNGVRWRFQWEVPGQALVQAAREYCGFAAFLRFARVPYFEIQGDVLKAADLRYALPGENFSRIETSRGAPCPEFVPPWRPPLGGRLGS